MDWIEFIRGRLREKSVVVSRHADLERTKDGLSIFELEHVLGQCKVLEEYSDDPRGESCLALGYTSNDRPVHCVCGKSSVGSMVLITVYVPSEPKWIDPETRNPKPVEGPQ